MGAYDMVLKRGRVLLMGGALTECDVAIQDGRIAALAAPGSLTQADEVVDLAGLLVMKVAASRMSGCHDEFSPVRPRPH
jgi:N-acyl-D-aspartate/D-glutamate deacylase